MIGFLIGLGCGAGELYLLVLLTRALQHEQGGKIAGIIFLKVALFAIAFILTILIDTQDLLWCGIGATAVLVIGAFILSRRFQHAEKGDFTDK